MKVHFEDREYELDLEEIGLSEARIIKRQTGFTVKGLLTGIFELDPDALAATYWLMQLQNGVTMDMNKLTFKVMKFSMALNDAFEAEAEAEKVAEAENPTTEVPGEAVPAA